MGSSVPRPEDGCKDWAKAKKFSKNNPVDQFSRQIKEQAAREAREKPRFNAPAQCVLSFPL